MNFTHLLFVKKNEAHTFYRKPCTQFIYIFFLLKIRWLCFDGNYYSVQLMVAAGMGPILAIKYFRYTYRPSKINTLQQAERLGGPILSLGTIEPQPRSIEKDVSTLSITQPKNRNPVYEPLLSDSPNATRRSFGAGTPFDFFQSQSRLSLSSYTRNCKDNWD